jgi:hypothetical protein
MVALDGKGDLFVVNYGLSISDGSIGEYTTTGATGIALDGLGDIFESNCGDETVGEYSTAGATVNAHLISGLSDPSGLAFVQVNVPEHASFVVSFSLLLPLFLFAWFCRRQEAMAVQSNEV